MLAARRSRSEELRRQGIVKLPALVFNGRMNMPTIQPLSYSGYRFPAVIISHCTWLYFRFALSYRDVAIHFDDIEGEGQFGLRVIRFEGRRLNGAPGTPFVSSNGAKDAVVWVVESNRFENDDGDDSVLHAWNAVTGELLYSSPKTATQNLGNGRKFSSIAVLKGKVLVGAASIACYGLKREDL
jgi:hypothetical protein